MKKLLCIFILLLSVTTFALQKSGIKEYDDLDLTKEERFITRSLPSSAGRGARKEERVYTFFLCDLGVFA